MLASSNVVETPPAAYSGGATYALGDTCSTGTAGGAIAVWESLQAANTGHSPPASPTWWKGIGETWAAWDGGATYAADDRVLLASTHRVYQSVQGANTNHNPATDDGTWWVEAGPTNRWALLDACIGTVTARPEAIDMKVDPGLATCCALLDLLGTEARIVVEDSPGGNVVYDETFDLSDAAILLDWWMYFFDPIENLKTLIVEDLIPYQDARVRVLVSAAGLAECGTLILGNAVEIGETVYAPRIGIIDYSRKQTDEFGATSVVERAYARRMELDAIIKADSVDYAAQRLAEVRAVPCLWLAGGRYGSLVIYGWVRDWGITIAYPTFSQASLTIEGLI